MPVINDTTEGAQLARHPVGLRLWQGRPPLSALALGWWHAWEPARLLGRRGSCPLHPPPHLHSPLPTATHFPPPSPLGPLVLRCPHPDAFFRRICTSIFVSLCSSCTADVSFSPPVISLCPAILYRGRSPPLPLSPIHVLILSGCVALTCGPRPQATLGPRRSRYRRHCPSGRRLLRVSPVRSAPPLGAGTLYPPPTAPLFLTCHPIHAAPSSPL